MPSAKQKAKEINAPQENIQQADSPKRTEWKWLAWLLIIFAILYSLLPLMNIIKILSKQ